MYTVTASNGIELLEHKHYKLAWRAIECWMKLSKKWPMDVEIIAQTENEANELRKLVNKYRNWFEEIHEKFDCPYKLDYLLQEAEKEHKYFGNENLPIFECYPFTVG